jgi:hypothetical protein
MKITRKFPATTAAATLLLAATLTSIACADEPASPGAIPNPPGEWVPLLEDASANAWRGWKTDALPKSWHVEQGTISKAGRVEDLLTRKEYGNFELELEWKIGKAGNSGILYRGTREYDYIYWSAPEYQLLDDVNNEDGRNRLTSAASDYDLYAAPAGILRPYDHWNTTRIVVNGAHVEHWLNGQKVVEYELWSPDWIAKVAASKFAAYPHYGLSKNGYIGIQGDHAGTLSLRHIRIRELP